MNKIVDFILNNRKWYHSRSENNKFITFKNEEYDEVYYLRKSNNRFIIQIQFSNVIVIDDEYACNKLNKIWGDVYGN